MNGTVTLAPLPPAATKLRNGAGKAVERRQQRFVAHILAGLAAKRAWIAGDLEWADRIAEDAIAVGHFAET